MGITDYAQMLKKGEATDKIYISDGWVELDA
jgi:hypothetical protein